MDELDRLLVEVREVDHALHVVGRDSAEYETVAAHVDEIARKVARIADSAPDWRSPSADDETAETFRRITLRRHVTVRLLMKAAESIARARATLAAASGRLRDEPAAPGGRAPAHAQTGGGPAVRTRSTPSRVWLRIDGRARPPS